jgi:alpha-tubulin suppressor-like RCC1 family protein
MVLHFGRRPLLECLDGQRGITAAYEEVAPRKLEIPYKLKHIACGLNHTLAGLLTQRLHCVYIMLTLCAVTADGELVAWGNGLYGKLGNGSTDSLLQPTVIKNAPQRLKYVSCGCVLY